MGEGVGDRRRSRKFRIMGMGESKGMRGDEEMDDERKRERPRD